MSSIGQNKLENSETLELCIFYFSNHIIKLTLFILGLFHSVFRFWVSYTTKNLSKIKLSEISEFSILGIGQNGKLGNLGNWHFPLLKPREKVNVFFFGVIFQSVFRFWVSYTTKNLSKRKLSEISEFSILGIGQNRKLGNLGNWHFSLLKPHEKVSAFFFGVIFQSVFRFWVSYNAKNLSKRKLSEISEFLILGIGQNRKLGNFGN